MKKLWQIKREFVLATLEITVDIIYTFYSVFFKNRNSYIEQTISIEKAKELAYSKIRSIPAFTNSILNKIEISEGTVAWYFQVCGTDSVGMDVLVDKIDGRSIFVYYYHTPYTSKIILHKYSKYRNNLELFYRKIKYKSFYIY